MKIMPVQKQTRAGQRTRFKAFVAIGDFNGHVGLGVKCAKEVATAIRGAIILAKLSVIPVRRGYWGNKLGEPHTVPCKVNGKVGSVFVGLIPAPRGTGIVAAPASKRMLQLAGVEDCYTCSRGNTSTMGSPFALRRAVLVLLLTSTPSSTLTGNFIKATYAAITQVRLLPFAIAELAADPSDRRRPTASSPPTSGPRSSPRLGLTRSSAVIFSSRRRSSTKLHPHRRDWN